MQILSASGIAAFRRRIKAMARSSWRRLRRHALGLRRGCAASRCLRREYFGQDEALVAGPGNGLPAGGL